MENPEGKRKDKFRLSVEKDVFILQAVKSDGQECKMPDNIKLKNISRGGLCVVTDIELEKGCVIEAEIMLEDVLNSVKAFCQAVWKNKAEKDRNFETGMKIIGIKAEDVKNLEAFLHKHQKKE
jgi:hypothetical protein